MCMSKYACYVFFLGVECIKSNFDKQNLRSLGHMNDVLNSPFWLQGQRVKGIPLNVWHHKAMHWKTMKVYCNFLVRHGLEVILLVPNSSYGSRCFVPKKKKEKRNTVHGIGYVKTR